MSLLGFFLQTESKILILLVQVVKGIYKSWEWCLHSTKWSDMDPISTWFSKLIVSSRMLVHVSSKMHLIYKAVIMYIVISTLWNTNSYKNVLEFLWNIKTLIHANTKECLKTFRSICIDQNWELLIKGIESLREREYINSRTMNNKNLESSTHSSLYLQFQP